MKNWGPEALCNIRMATPPPAHMTQKDGRKFDPERFADLCIKKGYDPAEGAIAILELEKGDLDPKARLDAHIKLMEYVYAKKRAVEHSGSISMSLPELLEQVEAEWHARPSEAN